MTQSTRAGEDDPEGEGPPPIAVPGRDEMNLAEFPIALLCDRAPRGQCEIEFHDSIFDAQSGREVVRSLTITSPEKYGLPTAADDDVILALLQLTKQQNNFARPEVHFTRLQLIELLGWADKGSSYARVVQSLHRWASTYLSYRNSWWDHSERRWTSGGFHIVDSFEVVDGRSSTGGGGQARSAVSWGKVFFRSCRSGYLKSLDYRLYKGLNYHTSKRMYRFLDKRFYHKAEWAFELRDFALEHIGLSRSYAHNGKIKEKLWPAIVELESVGYLEPMPKADRFRRQGREWLVCFKKAAAVELGAGTPGGPGAPAPTPGRAGADHPAVRELAARGVTESTARELVGQHPAALVSSKLEIFDWLMSKEDRRVRKSPAGYLVESIRRDYAPPRGFVPAEDRRLQEERRLHLELEALRERHRRAAEQARARQEVEAIDAYWDALDSEGKAALDAAAQRSADPTRYDDLGHSPALQRMRRRVLRQDYIRALLRDRHHPLFSPPAPGDEPPAR
ncbi:replication initiator protein A [Tautonia plasticadhaerens]|uniref:Replication initiator protein A n=1 Tax=Tautonia plasticadhaerens TaxID=2527974 RepID=A0A518HDZ7_9BACT|nr:replication initiator protein A [Tautonia plasticadhaerens]QDV39077.1 Replication initiator protein A [Tautonia plasticadhaerens]